MSSNHNRRIDDITRIAPFRVPPNVSKQNAVRGANAVPNVGLNIVSPDVNGWAVQATGWASYRRLINFIMTSEPTNSHHIFKSATEKATNPNPSFRHPDAATLLIHIEKNVLYHQQAENKERILAKIASETLDEEVETFLSELTNQ
jgi:hypothetical protein